MCCAFTTIAGMSSASRMLYSGFQYDAVLSIATISQPFSLSHDESSISSLVDAPNSLVSFLRPRIRQQTITFLCTSTPPHTEYITSILASLIEFTADLPLLAQFFIRPHSRRIVTMRGPEGRPVSVLFPDSYPFQKTHDLVPHHNYIPWKLRTKSHSSW